MFVHYCSSDTWSGTRAADEETGGYIFHGRHVFEVRNECSRRFYNHRESPLKGHLNKVQLLFFFRFILGAFSVIVKSSVRPVRPRKGLI